MDRQDSDVLERTQQRSDRAKQHGASMPQPALAQGSAAAGLGARPVVIAATFTADPIARPLKFWMDVLGHFAVKLAPYAQVMQELLAPQSLLAQNKAGFNVLLLRLEDWIRDRADESVERNIDHVHESASDLIAAIEVLKTRTNAPLLVLICPQPASLPAEYANPFRAIEKDLMMRLKNLPHVHAWTQDELARLYPTAGHEDARTDRIAHIPYTIEYFAAMATLLARRIAALSKPQYKVIAIDCDNTLWKGVCGEDGAAGVELTPAHIELQRMMVRQHDAGMLLCLCSKNNPGDVDAVFMARPEMPLRQEHLVCSRVNWSAKSSNLQSIADELNLSLDSFIFVDDSALECAEVQAHCPAVLTLQLPATDVQIEHFVEHVWAFDRIGVTQEAKRRTAQYKENRARTAALEEAGDLDKFLASLDLKVDIAPMQGGQLARVAELIHRTNQFNLTAQRRSVGEIDLLVESGEIEILVVTVHDRFGDYGLVGALLLRRSPQSLDVDTFVLSCRALGRGVEHRLVNELGLIAEREGRPDIALRYKRTERNAPAWTFLQTSFMQFRSSGTGGPADSIFTVPAVYAKTLGCAPAPLPVADEGDGARSPAGQTAAAGRMEWHETAYRLSRPGDVLREISRCLPIRQAVDGEYVAPQSPMEEALAGIWADVLGLAEVSTRADFFDLGGDSLLAVQAISRVGSVLGLDLPLYEFFANPTVERIAGHLAHAVQSAPLIQRASREDALPLSWAQQRLWFIDQLEGGSAAYHIPLAARLRGELNRPALQEALDSLLERHEALRTTFVKKDGEVVQEIALSARFVLRTVELAADAEQVDSEVRKHAHEELIMPFDLGVGPLIRGRLLRLAERDHVLLLTMHHMISDGWSIGVMLRELGTLYGAYREGQPNPLQAMPIQYADYAQWQRQWLSGKELQRQLAHWTSHLRGAPEMLELPTDRPRPPVQSYRGASVPVTLGVDLTAEMKALSRRLKLTLAMTLYGAWSILLARLSGQEDIVVGMPVANRRRTELEGLIGFFVNTVAVRARLDDDPSVEDFLQQVKGSMLAAYANQDVPFEQVVEALQPARSLSHSPIYQVLFVLQNAPRDAMHLPGLSLVEEEVPLHTAQFDLTLSLQESAQGVSGSLNYASDLFDGATIERWVDCLTIVLNEMVRQPHSRVSALPMMSVSDLERVIRTFNATQVAYPQEKLIHELFEEQVERTPEAVAVTHGSQQLSYRALNRRANQLARYLRDRGVGPDDFVGLCVERGVEMVVGILGILKAGGAYVPLDPAYPRQRLEYMLNDTSPKLVLTQDRLKQHVPHAGVVIALDGQADEIAQQPEHDLSRAAVGLNSHHLAYVIYTSGSTGQPKGVAIEHRNTVNLIYWGREAMAVQVFEQTLHSTSLNFDLSAYECFVPLATGGSLRVVSNALALANEPQGVTLINTVPSAIRAVLDSGRLSSTIQVVNLAGEALDKALVERIFAHSEVEQVCNLYGPSETTTYSSWVSMPREQGFVASIGRPIANTQFYILDRHRQVVPVGVAGEIYIGGTGVARGYLNRPELTAQRFVADPFSTDAQARMYKTGDVGRWRADGTIEYLGRDDHQVKIRGFRVELGEIEAQLTRHAQVKQAVVIAREDVPGEKRLVGYIVAHDPGAADAAPSVEDLRAHLKSALPEHMVPGAFVMLERLPLTANGKLDRSALPAPEAGACASREYEPPQSAVEATLAQIWQSLLHVERVGRQDNFFELGGHSLLIVQMLERLRRAGLSAELRRVFETPTLADLARTLGEQAAEQVAPPPNLIPAQCAAITPQMLPLVELTAEQIERIVQSVGGGVANIQDIYPLAPLQEGILFHHLMSDSGGDAYVVPMLLSVSSRERLDELIQALQSVIDRHDILRTAVLWEQLPQPVQVVYRHATLPVEQIQLERGRDASQQMRERLNAEYQRLDVRQAPLLRLQVTPDPYSAQWYVVLQLHHIIGDNTSQEIVVAEVLAHLEHRAQHLPQSVPYRNHVAQALAYARTHDAGAFFRSKLAEIDEPTAPFGLLDVHGDGSRLEEAHRVFDVALAHKVRLQARRLGVSAATLFHAAWALVVARTSGRETVVFGSVLLGRMHGDAGAQRILGMFINTLPLRLRLGEVSAVELIQQTQRELVELLSHEQASLAVAQRSSGITGSAPLFSSLLNYRHSVASPAASWGSAQGVRVLATQDRTNYPLTLSVEDQGGEGFTLHAQTDRRIDPHRVTEYVYTAMHSLVEALAQSPQVPALSLSILSPKERRQLIETFNATQAAYPQEKLIHELFEEQVERTPEAVAVVCGDWQLTYSQLNSQANRVAHELRARGVLPNERVALYVDRGVAMAIGVLGILKAGGGYVPLDTNYPLERIAYMLGDSSPVLLLTQARLCKNLPANNLQTLRLDADCELMNCRPAHNPEPAAIGLQSRHLAYVIYTSGSTGTPKGVMVEHRSVVNLIHWHCDAFDLSAGCRSSCVAAVGFDAASWEILPPLAVGATLVIASADLIGDAEAFLSWWANEPLDVSFLPTPMAELAFSRNIRNATLRTLLVGGDRLSQHPGPQRFSVVNNYGPTESTVVATSGRICDGDEVLHIGRPIANTRIYILDRNLQPLPLGVSGELYIGGAGVARGYLNRPDLEAQRFLDDPFSSNLHARMYRTGDLVRWRSDGTIEFLGRNDEQVKIRGYRIELGEIEAQLGRHEQVREVAVVACEQASGEKRLVAYIVRRDSQVSDADEFRSYLKAVLPEYMVPSAFVTLDSLPLTAHGKLDRRALPAPDAGAYASGAYEAPEGEAEQILAAIWQELLQVERVGRRDNFFDLGGHSLLALKSLFNINQSFGCGLRVTDIYKNPTVHDLAMRVGAGSTEDELVDLGQEATLDEDIVPGPPLRRTHAKAVMLTGGTGFVGRFLLAQLLNDTQATVYCLVRAKSAHQASLRLRATLSKWDLWRDEFEDRIVAVPGDLRLPRLGIAADTYQMLCRTIDSIYHCATSMNHLETYAMAKPANVGAARELLRLATHHKPKLVNYISTLGVFSAATSDPGRIVNEATPIDSEKHLTASGYVASKWVGEKIFMAASARGIACNIFRLGFIWADTQQGRYDELQHGHRILKSCLLSGYGIENYHYDMAPTPVDYAARAVVLLGERHRDGQGIFHISAASGPRAEGIFERCNDMEEPSLELLPAYEWIGEMKRLHHEGRSLPATPLIEYAFAMDEGSFHENERRAQSTRVQFDCSRTHRELESAGIVAPVLDDDLLRTCLAGMIAWDDDLLEMIDSNPRLRFTRARHVAAHDGLGGSAS